jgi:anti-anti-sigma factor
MSVVRATEPFHPARPDHTAQVWECHGTRLSAQRLGSSEVLLTAEGEIDASNADRLGEYAHLHSLQCDRLILDLSRLEFFGTEGFSALHKFNVTCAESGVRWALVPSPAVARLLRICDPEGGLAGAPTVEAALAQVQGARRRLLELVRKS